MVRKAAHVKQGDLFGHGDPCRSQSAHSSVDAGQRPPSKGAQEGGCVMKRRSDPIPAPVSAPRRAKQAGDAQARWDWTEPTVCTLRMRIALDRGMNAATCFTGHGLLSVAAAHRFRSSVLFEVRPPTGEPCAGEPHARFGGRGGQETGLPYPYHVPDLTVFGVALVCRGTGTSRLQ